MIQYSIGELIDRLIITNLKIYHLEENIKDLNTKHDISADQILPLCEQVVSLNKLRNELISSISEFFENK